MKSINGLTIKIFADGADLKGMLELYSNPLVKGFTTNPTLMRKAGVKDYEAFAKKVLRAIPDRPISFEVFSDDFSEMKRQAFRIAGWGENVYVKIPVTNTAGERSTPLIRELAAAGLKLNVTAVFTLRQVWEVTAALAGGPPAVVSVFAGRIADAGLDPVPHMSAALEIVRTAPGVELLWASPRELLNIVQADAIGCDIITVTPDILKKLNTIGKDLKDYSLDTVKMFYDDGVAAGFEL
jgi:transaldolase